MISTTSIRRDLELPPEVARRPVPIGLDSVSVPEPYFTFGEVRLRRRRSPGNLRIVRSDAGLTHSATLLLPMDFANCCNRAVPRPKSSHIAGAAPCLAAPGIRGLPQVLPVSHGPPRRQADGADDATAAEFHPLAQDHFALLLTTKRRVDGHSDGRKRLAQRRRAQRESISSRRIQVPALHETAFGSARQSDGAQGSPVRQPQRHGQRSRHGARVARRIGRKRAATVDPAFLDSLRDQPDQSFPVKLGPKTVDVTLKDVIFDATEGNFPHPNTMTVKLMEGNNVLLEQEYYSVGGGFIEWKGYKPPRKRAEVPVRHDEGAAAARGTKQSVDFRCNPGERDVHSWQERG